MMFLDSVKFSVKFFRLVGDVIIIVCVMLLKISVIGVLLVIVVEVFFCVLVCVCFVVMVEMMGKFVGWWGRKVMW